MKILCLTPIKHLDGIYEHLESFGSVDYKPELKTIDFSLDDYDVIFCNPNKQSYKLDEKTLPDFRGTILTASTGLNHIDVDYCDKKGIKVLSHKDDMKLLNQLPSTAELAFGLMLSILRNIPSSFRDVKQGGWDYTQFMGRQLKGLTVGIIGYGRLGKMMANYCRSFGANVLAYDPHLFNYMGVENPMHGVDHVNHLEDLFKKCDVISLHVHVTDETKHMINQDLLNLSKKDMYIINTSRGEIVNEEDVVKYLKSGRLKGYATDVLEDEYTNRLDSPILNGAKEGLNIIITPHMGGSTWEGQTKAYKWSISKLGDLK